MSSADYFGLATMIFISRGLPKQMSVLLGTLCLVGQLLFMFLRK